MDIPINAKVYCQDKLCGHTKAVVLNPVTDVITHVVVQENNNSHTERLVPIEMFDASLNERLHINLDEPTLKNLPPFVEVEYVQTTIPRYENLHDISFMEPVVTPIKKFFPEKIYHIPKDELAVQRGADVYSAEGRMIGKVDEFLVEEDGHRVTHLILREDHLLGHKDVFIPVSDIESIDENSLKLRLSKENIEKLPTIPVKRIWS